MGKRSNFKRRPMDTYDTPESAIIPLLDHLPWGCRYWEPCAGRGDMVRHLGRYGVDCMAATDIEPRCETIYRLDALTVTRDDVDATGATHIITNPVWSRPILHAMIDHFSAIRPTWLLFDADWMHTVQAVIAKKHGLKTAPELLRHCRKIVSVGRVRWIEGSTMSGKDNCQWFLFDQRGSGPTEFVGR